LKSILNRVFWDKRERAEDYIVIFIHRGNAGNTKTISLTKIKHVANSSFTYHNEKGDETTIPFHRVTVVKNTKSDRTLWQKRGITP